MAFGRWLNAKERNILFASIDFTMVKRMQAIDLISSLFEEKTSKDKDHKTSCWVQIKA